MMTGINGHSQSDSCPRAFPLLDFVRHVLWAGGGKESSKQGSVTDCLEMVCGVCGGVWGHCRLAQGQTGDRTASVLTLAAECLFQAGWRVGIRFFWA